MEKRHWNRLLAALSVLMMLLTAACTSGSQQTGSDNKSSAGEKTATAQKVKVAWWAGAGEDAERQAVQKIFVDSFNKAHPAIELEIVFQEDLDRVLRTAIQGGAAPDLIETPGPAFVAEYVSAGHVVNLDTYAAKYKWNDIIFPWALNVGKLEGKLYSLPLTYETLVLWYNKALFEKNGWKPPTTRAEMEFIAKEAAKKGIFPFANSNSEWKGVNEWLAGYFLNSYAGADNVYQALTSKKKWTDKEFVESIQLLDEYMQNGWFSGRKENYYAFTFDDTWGNLKSGKAAMNIEGTWAFGNAKENFADNPNDWDWVPLPPLREGLKPVFDLGIGSTISINAKSKNADAAAEVLNWIFNDKQRAAQMIVGIPGEWVVPMALSKSDFPAGTEPRFIRALETIAEASAQNRYGYTTWTFWPAKSDAYIIEAMEQVWNKKITAGAFLAELQKTFDAEVKDRKMPPVPARQ